MRYFTVALNWVFLQLNHLIKTLNGSNNSFLGTFQDTSLRHNKLMGTLLFL